MIKQQTGLIARNVNYKMLDTTLTLCSALVRPHSEYTVYFLSPNFMKDEKQERVKRKKKLQSEINLMNRLEEI